MKKVAIYPALMLQCFGLKIIIAENAVTYTVYAVIDVCDLRKLGVEKEYINNNAINNSYI